MRINHLSLFSGVGGLDLAAEWADMTTAGQCEWAEYPTKVLEKHWPDVPRRKDIRTLTKESFYERTGLRTVDVISGGFPCQPFSVAGKRRGKEDDRYLWPEMVRVIQELRPTWVVGENVAGIVRMALPDILSELEACGYRTRTFLIPACGVGARHRRYRVAIVAHADDTQTARHRKYRGETYARAETEGSCLCGNGGAQSMENSGGFRRGESENVREQPWGAKSERTSTDLAHTNGPGLQTPGPEQQAAGFTGNGKDVANAESQHEGRLSVGTKTEDTGSGGSSEDVADTQSKRNRGLPVQPGRSQQEDTDIKWSCENVQYPYGTGRKEQHSSSKSDKPGFFSWRCDVGDVRNTTSERLPDGTGVPLGGYGTPEPEPQRSGSDVSDTDYGSGAVWRNGTIPEIEKAGAGGCDFGGGAEKHEPRQCRTAQPGLGGVADGISGGMDRDFLINHYWDAEPDTPRVASGVPNRVDRLKALGNAVVPQQFYPVFRAIVEIERRERVGK